MMLPAMMFQGDVSESRHGRKTVNDVAVTKRERHIHVRVLTCVTFVVSSSSALAIEVIRLSPHLTCSKSSSHHDLQQITIVQFDYKSNHHVFFFRNTCCIPRLKGIFHTGKSQSRQQLILVLNPTISQQSLWDKRSASNNGVTGSCQSLGRQS